MTTRKRTPTRKISENDLLRRILDLARLTGWRTAHFRQAMNERGHWRTPVAGDGKGFPDLVLVRKDRLIFAELKSSTGRTTPQQQQWLDCLALIPSVEVYLWRPTDWQEVQRTLGR